MATNKQSALDELLLDHSLDHILNSPEEEFVHFVNEFGLNIQDLKAISKEAAENAFSNEGTASAIAGEVPVSYIDKLVAAAKRLNFSLTKEDFKGWTENSLNSGMAYSRTHKEKRKAIRKRK